MTTSSPTKAERDTPTDLIDDALVQWIREVTGGDEVKIERRGGGASRAGYAVDVVGQDGVRNEYWLRIDTGFGPQSSTQYTVQREGAVYRSLRDTAVKVARLIAIHPTRDAFLAERLVGQNWFSEITNVDEQISTAREFMGQLAALHDIDVNTMELPELGPVSTIDQHVRDELAIWDEQYRSGEPNDPVISLALAWLSANIPPNGDWPVVLVQGDTGPGNFMYADGHVVAVMDWEMAHWGDIHDDFGWLCVRDTQERFTYLPDRFADYERFGGRTVDLPRLRYFRVLAQTRCAVGTRRGLLAQDSRGEIANHLIFSTLHRRLLADALAAAMGVAEAPGNDETDDLGMARSATSGATSHSWLFDVALDDLRNVVVPAMEPGFARQRAKGLARLLKYLRRAGQLGEAVDRQERSDLATLVGPGVANVAAARAEVCSRLTNGTLDHELALGYCVRSTRRDVEIARDAMGALADRAYSPIE